MITVLNENSIEDDHPELTSISSAEYEEIKEDLFKEAQALCNYNGYLCVCIALKTPRNCYLVNFDTGYLFTANSLEEYKDILNDWGFENSMPITVFKTSNDT